MNCLARDRQGTPKKAKLPEVLPAKITLFHIQYVDGTTPEQPWYNVVHHIMVVNEADRDIIRPRTHGTQKSITWWPQPREGRTARYWISPPVNGGFEFGISGCDSRWVRCRRVAVETMNAVPAAASEGRSAIWDFSDERPEIAKIQRKREHPIFRGRTCFSFQSKDVTFI